MKKANRIFYISSLVLWDFLCTWFSVQISFKLKFGFFREIPQYYLNNQGSYILFCALVIIGLNIIFRCYNSVWRHAGLSEVIRQVISVLLFGVIAIATDRILRQGIPFEVMILISGVMLLSMLLGRFSVVFVIFIKNKLQGIRKKKHMRRILVYGAGELGAYLHKKLYDHPEDGMQVVAYLDDKKELHGCKVAGVKVYGGFDELPEILDDLHIDEVIVAIANPDKDFLKQLIRVCKSKKCTIRRFGTIDNLEERVENARLNTINLEELLRRDSVHLNMKAVKDFVQDKVVLVTGGCGSIGSEICRQVLRFGAKKLIVFDINENGLFAFDNELKEIYDQTRYSIRLGSVRDRKRMDEIFKEFEPQLVFHAAAHKHVPMMELNPKEAVKNNVFGTINVAQVAINHQAEKFILISTDKAVNPTNIMGASKRIAEMVIQMMDKVSDTDFAAVRFGNVLGSNGSVVPFFQKQIEEGGPVTVTHPEMRRYFMTIPEAVQLVLEAGAMADGGEIFVLDMGEPVLIYDLACDMIRLSGLEPEKDIKIVFTGLRPGEKLFEEISLAEENTTKTSNNKIYINKPVENNLNWFAKNVKHLEETLSLPGMDEMFDSVKDIVSTFEHNDNVKEIYGNESADR